MRSFIISLFTCFLANTECVCLCVSYLQRQVVYEGAASKSDQQQVGEDKGSHGICHFLDFSVSLRPIGLSDGAMTDVF